MPAPKKPTSIRTSIHFDPPTLEEAIFAAQGLTDVNDDHAAVAASLMGWLPEAEVKAALLTIRSAKTQISRRLSVQVQSTTRRTPVVVERRVSRTSMR
ncbi:hypothetical protein [Microvirga yunnanensis]|uniref:hypothetical protein n=1 Tax=Microvirga yunnanensis TaxID=2953740 RepID=UPI0021CAD151|nr:MULTISPECIES: hypothetical protein [unclassified Microvirga]